MGRATVSGRLGVTLLGRLEDADSEQLVIGDQLLDHIAHADQGAAQMKGMLAMVVDKMAPDAPAATRDPAEAPLEAAAEMGEIRRIDLEDAGIKTVIWATGFRGSYDCLKFDIGIDSHGIPEHDQGASLIDGLDFIGIPWLRTRMSGLIPGAAADATHLAERLANSGRRRDRRDARQRDAASSA